MGVRPDLDCLTLRLGPGGEDLGYYGNPDGSAGDYEDDERRAVFRVAP